MQKNTFRLRSNRSKITVENMSRQDQEHRLPETYLKDQLSSFAGQSMEALEGWRNSPEFQAALKIGEKYAKFNIVAVNGLK